MLREIIGVREYCWERVLLGEGIVERVLLREDIEMVLLREGIVSIIPNAEVPRFVFTLLLITFILLFDVISIIIFYC